MHRIATHHSQLSLYEHGGMYRWLPHQDVWDLGAQAAWDVWTPCLLDKVFDAKTCDGVEGPPPPPPNEATEGS